MDPHEEEPGGSEHRHHHRHHHRSRREDDEQTTHYTNDRRVAVETPAIEKKLFLAALAGCGWMLLLLVIAAASGHWSATNATAGSSSVHYRWSLTQFHGSFDPPVGNLSTYDSTYGDLSYLAAAVVDEYNATTGNITTIDGQEIPVNITRYETLLSYAQAIHLRSRVTGYWMLVSGGSALMLFAVLVSDRRSAIFRPARSNGEPIPARSVPGITWLIVVTFTMALFGAPVAWGLCSNKISEMMENGGAQIEVTDASTHLDWCWYLSFFAILGTIPVLGYFSVRQYNLSRRHLEGAPEDADANL